MKYRPSKSFVIAMAGLAPLLVALIFGLLPELDAMRKPKIPGELSFPAKRPVPVRKSGARRGRINGPSGGGGLVVGLAG